MRCRDATAWLSARLDGRLGPDDVRALDAHLAGCASCRRELATWEAAARALRAAGPTPVPPFLAERAFRAATREGPSPAAGFLGAARKVAIAGAVAAAGVWLAAVATGAAARHASDASQDPMEVAMVLWTAEGGR